MCLKKEFFTVDKDVQQGITITIQLINNIRYTDINVLLVSAAEGLQKWIGMIVEALLTI